MEQPPRVPWRAFPDVVLLADESRTRRHPLYRAAKTGDAGSAAILVHALVEGVNAIPVALARPYSTVLNPSQEQLHELGQQHGPALEQWWRDRFGHTFDCLTQSEARYLAHSPDLTASEIELLQRSKREMVRVAHEILASEPGASKA